MPRSRHPLLSATIEIQARSPCSCATAMPDELVTDDRDDGGLPDLAADTTSDTGKTGWSSWGSTTLVPDGDRLVEVVVVEVAQSPWGHAGQHTSFAVDVIARMGGIGMGEQTGRLQG